LLDLGWQPLAADHWQDEEGDSWQLQEGTLWSGGRPCDGTILQALARSCERLVWKAAAPRLGAPELADGVDMHGAKRALKYLRTDPLRHGAGEAVVTGAIWTRERITQVCGRVEADEEAGDDGGQDNVEHWWSGERSGWCRTVDLGGGISRYEHSDPLLCRRCDASCPEDRYHLFYGCPANQAAISSLRLPRELKTVERETAEASPGLYYNGIPAYAATVVPPPPETAPVFRAGRLPRGHEQGVLVGTLEEPLFLFCDATGGRATSDRRLRRAGYGFAIWQGEDRPGQAPIAHGGFGQLPGAAQSVNRGELYAVVTGLDGVSGVVHLVTDSSYVAKGMGKMAAATGKKTPPFTSHADLWAQLADRIVSQGLMVITVKVESHLEEDEERRLLLGTPRWLVAGNVAADALAAQGVQEVLAGDAAAVRRVDLVAAAVVRRNAAILSAAAAVDKRVRRPPRLRKRVTVEDLLAQSAHAPVKEEGRWRCSRCHSAATGSNVRKWLLQPCLPEADCLPFGGRSFHPSHTLTFWDNVQVWACDGCGHYAKDHARGLALPCTPPKEHGRATLSLLRRGGMPGGSEAAVAHNRLVIRRRGPLTRPRARPGPRRRREAPARPAADDGGGAEGAAGAEAAAEDLEPEPVVTEPEPELVVTGPAAPPPAVARRCGHFKW
jgi:ribonuclease HI